MPHYQGPSPEETDELHLPTQPDCVVIMKRRATRGDVFDAEEAHLNLRQRQSENGAVGNGTFAVGFYQCMTLTLIVDWNLENADGTKWPADDPHSLRRLDPVDGLYLETEARRRTEGQPRGPFVNGSSPTSTASAEIPTSESAESSSSTGSRAPTAGRRTSSGASAART